MVFIVTYLLLIVTMKVLAYLIMIPRESLLMHDCCCFCVLSFISQHWKFLWASIERRWAMLRAWELNCKRKKAHTAKARSFKGAQALQVNKVWSTESSGFMLHFRDSSLYTWVLLLASRHYCYEAFRYINQQTPSFSDGFTPGVEDCVTKKEWRI